MSAHADDLRYYYSETLGRMTELTAGNGSSVRLTVALEPGRYAVRVRDWSTATGLWLRQGGDAVDAAAAAPSTFFWVPTDDGLNNAPLTHIMVRGASPGGDKGSVDDYVAAFGVGGAVAVQLTKVSRGKR